MNYKRITKSSIIAALIVVAGFFAGSQSIAEAQGDSEINKQLAQVRRATAKYHDVNTAIEDGFAQVGGCDEDENGVAGIHYVNTARFISPEVILEEPEVLLYVPSGDGNLRLVAIEYTNRALYRDTRPPNTPGYRPGIFPSQQNPRPPYLEEVSGPFSLFDQPSNGPAFVGRWFYFLYAWVWSPNPNGMFADGNPRLNCTANN